VQILKLWAKLGLGPILATADGQTPHNLFDGQTPHNLVDGQTPQPVVHGVSSSLLGPAVPSFRALSGRLKFTVGRHKFNKR